MEWKALKKKKKGHYINPDYEPRYKILDSTYKLLKQQVKQKDTIFLDHEVYAKVDFRELIDFDKAIEDGKCAIIDNNNVRHYLIIRRKGSWILGPLNGGGERRYFLPGNKQPFYSIRDWSA